MTQVRTLRLALATGLLGLTVAAVRRRLDDTATADTETAVLGAQRPRWRPARAPPR
jgi:hypothetical protein